MEITAAVTPGKGAPFEIKTLQLDDPRPNEVRVKLTATGVCHTDAIVRDQVYPTPLPAVLGHEGAGVVEAIGEAVTTIKPGDHVVLGFNSCGECTQCVTGRPAYCKNFYDHNFSGLRPDGTTALSDNGSQVSSHFFGQSSFASHANVSVRSVVKVDDDAPLDLLGPLGCGLMTGAGSIINALNVSAGETVAIFGTGAVGSSAIMAAAAVGATTIIAIDLVDSRLEAAKGYGATDTINSGSEDLGKRLHQIVGDHGVNVALDTTGITAVTRQAADAVGINGRVGLVGAPSMGDEVSFEVGASLLKGWSFQTIIEGDAVPQDFIPKLVGLWRQGKFPIEKLTQTYPLADINQAFEDSASGKTIKPIVLF